MKFFIATGIAGISALLAVRFGFDKNVWMCSLLTCVAVMQVVFAVTIGVAGLLKKK